ncbi:Mediator of RNA polymerase II transcription subunit 12 [Golovinomyces cichoracearum]|uniref:Mediator of RNA polymerase II transcription subunit 12 n=1 Tax=Golovinomyces cichoracearum TaxID=62708 RepID=A0A420HNQ7_9PEZI|nr:Mediator of RNA polymerase II transcription subunit 12 [Golovinomyces cichoracearum]
MSPQWPPKNNARPTSLHEILSQTQSGPSSTRKSDDSSTDLALDRDARPRLVMSRLSMEAPDGQQNVSVPMSPKPSITASFTGRLVLPSRGRPQNRRLAFKVNPVISTTMEIIQEEPSPKVLSLPMPVRPWRNYPSVPKNFSRCAPDTAKKDTRPKPYIAETPPLAPSFPPTGNTDFFPWAGNHLEDQFSEQTIRQGYYDKSQMTQNEIGSARSFIYPALKHKSGLHTLSSVFTNILAQRRAHGQITTSSTFKPPPRVTVTDTKREMWLKDLANPTMSLRRLSRSIPHGIRGKVLLEQSLRKNIPIERAVWLAKCVGANELRAFRRKGVSGTLAMGGEAKWIRDFTLCVEQFLESIIEACRETDFKVKFAYAIRLATLFHAERLLDRENYMDWVITSLENTSQIRLPIWLLVVQIYWKDLIQYRKYGRRLSSILLIQLSETHDNPDSDLLAPFSDSLTSLLKELMLYNHETFVAPKIWTKYRDLLCSKLGSDDEQLNCIIESIDARNSRLQFSDGIEKESLQRVLIRILDESLITPYNSRLAIKAWNLTKDKKQLVKELLVWSMSLYRPGKTKVYVTTRILRAWSKYGISITEDVLDFLDSTGWEDFCSRSDLYHVISELARSGHFSSSKYLQWLISRGGIQNPQDIGKDGPCASRLLAELPIANLNKSLLRTRKTLLIRANYSAEEEQDSIENYLSLLQRKISWTLEHLNSEMMQNNVFESNNEDLLFKMSRTVKSEIGLWLREKACLEATEQQASSMNDWNKCSIPKNGILGLTPSNFNTIRKTLEDIDDYSMLADVLKIFSKNCGVDILASCADTLNMHLEIFAAIGALREIYEIMLSRLRALKDESNSFGVFSNSLFDLSVRLEDQKLIGQELAQEMSHNIKKAGVDACSPISDCTTVVESTDSFLTDEIEKILVNGIRLSHLSFEHLFQRISSVLESSVGTLPEQQRNCGILLTRLRSFDTQKFRLLMMRWVNRFLTLSNRPNLMQFCAPLISSGCITFHDILESCEANLASTKSSNFSKITLEALVLLLSSTEISNIMTCDEIYRFRIKQLNIQRDFPADLVCAIRKTFELLPSTKNIQPQLKLDLDLLLEGRDLRQFLHYVILFDTKLFIDDLLIPILNSSNADAISAINKIIDLLLTTSRLHLMKTIQSFFEIDDELVLPFCQVKIAAMIKLEKTSHNCTESHLDLVEQLYTAVELAIRSGNTTWSKIINLLDVEITEKLREKAQIQFLALAPSQNLLEPDGPTVHERHTMQGKNFLSILKATSHCALSDPFQNTNNNTNLISEIAAALNSVWLILTRCQSEEVKNFIIGSWIPLLISFTLAHTTLFEANKTLHESRAKIILALAAIFLRLQGFDADNDIIEELIEQTYDLALHFVDHLSDDLRQQCIRSLHDAGSNPHISYLFSHVLNPSEPMVLYQKERLFNLHSNENFDDVSSTGNEKLVPFSMRRWEILGESTPNVGENDTSLSLTLFGARRG